MYLVEGQRDEIKNYILTIPRFTQANFSIDEVTRIFKVDVKVLTA